MKATSKGSGQQSKVGRPATGSLIWTKKGWAARIMTTVDGERVRVQRQLETTSKAAAQAKLARLLVSQNPTTAEARRSETFAEAARRIVAKQNIKTEAERLARLENWAFPEFGEVSVEAVKPGHIKASLERLVKAGRSRTTCKHLLVDIATVLDDLWRDEVLPENPARRVRVPRSALVDGRPRVVLTEDEFSRFMASPGIDPELQMVALTSRCLGGMRTADLHAWDWSHIDVVGWASAQVSRPKTKSMDRLGLPEVLVGPLHAWWDGQGRPTSGPVFPARRGARAGESKLAHSSYAERLREALWAAGVRRGATFAECELQTDTASTRRVDFHSFRRAYATALAREGVNVQQASKLAGHANSATHMRYVRLTEVMEMPLGALPRLLPLPAAKLETADSPTPRISCAPRRIRTFDLRLRRPAELEPIAPHGSFDAEEDRARGVAERLGVVERQYSAPKSERPLFDAGLADAVLALALRGLAERSALGVRENLLTPRGVS